MLHGIVILVGVCGLNTLKTSGGVRFAHHESGGVVICKMGLVQDLTNSGTTFNKPALDIYRRKEPRCDISNLQLRHWQEEALRLIDSPSKGQVICITGRQGYGRKTGLKIM